MMTRGLKPRIDVPRDRRRFTRGSQAWLSSSLRLRENLALWESLNASGRVRFEHMWRRWKAIAQVVPRRALALTRRALPPQAALQFVYRTAEHALENWCGQLKHVLQPSTRGEVIPQLTLCSRLHVEYLEHVIKPGQVFSMPIVTNASALALLTTCALAEADALLHNSADDVCFLQLVEGTLRRRKVPLTVAARDRRSMWCPVSVQLLHANTNCTPDHVDSFCLRPHGTPVVREMLELSSWRIIRGGFAIVATWSWLRRRHADVQRSGSNQPTSLGRCGGRHTSGGCFWSAWSRMAGE